MGVFAVILAGGEGRRLGFVDKAALWLGNKSLLQHAVANAKGQADHIALSHPASSVGKVFQDITVLPDPFQPPIGPLGGIYAGALWAQQQVNTDESFLLTMPVDSPIFPQNFAQRALELIKTADIVVGRYETQLYPACALWRLSAALEIAPYVHDSTNYAIRAVFENLQVLELDYAPIQARNPFENINKISDLLRFSEENQGLNSRM